MNTRKSIDKKTKKEPYVKVTPETVEFLYDSLGVSQAENSLLNTTKNWVAFKVKTNAPDFYIVRPNQGQIPPSESVLVTISAQWELFKTEPEKVKHKFLIEFAKCSGPLTDLTGIWQNSMIEKTKTVLIAEYSKRPEVKFDYTEEAAESQQEELDPLANEEVPKHDMAVYGIENVDEIEQNEEAPLILEDKVPVAAKPEEENGMERFQSPAPKEKPLSKEEEMVKATKMAEEEFKTLSLKRDKLKETLHNLKKELEEAEISKKVPHNPVQFAAPFEGFNLFSVLIATGIALVLGLLIGKQ